MALQLLDLEKSLLNLLGESYDTTALDLRAGAAGGATIAGITTSGSTASTAKALLNEAAAELARTCYPVPETGTYTWLAGERTHLISDFTPTTTGNVLWTVRGVKYGSQTVGLRYCDRSALERSDPDWMVTANAAPTYWYRDGEMSIGLYAKPTTSSATVTIDGYAVPKPLAAATDTLAWIPDDLTHLLVWYAAAKVAQKNLEDESLAMRAPVWQGLYDQGRMDLWNKIDLRIRKAHFPTPPMSGGK